MHKMKEIMEKLEECTSAELEKEPKEIDLCEVSRAIDCIKDCAKTMYYYTLYEAMKRNDTDTIRAYHAQFQNDKII